MEEKANYGANDAPNKDNTFCWEDNDKAFKAALNPLMDAEKEKESGWKKVVKNKPENKAKQGKYNRPVKVDATSQEENKADDIAKEKIRAKGDIAVDSKLGYQTDIQLSWVMKQGYQKFNIRAAVI
eukprot:10690982-Ditylum_brightwellii.AAC.1